MASLRLILALCLVACAAAARITKRNNPSAIPGEYLVELKKGSVNIASSDVEVIKKFHIGEWRALHVKVNDAQLAALAVDPNVELIEANTWEWSVSCTEETPGNTGLWGLRRISHRSLGATHMYDSDGSGAVVYVADTGIRITHNEVAGRATHGFTAFGTIYDDGNGHGTHCAGTVGGSGSGNTGVAKNCALVNVRVLGDNGSGSTDGVVAGINWASNDHNGRGVLSMSLGGGGSAVMDNAVNAASNNGLFVVVAAGNSNANACNYSPARAEEAYTVGATDVGDNRATYSNWGTCVDIFAPGSSVYSAWHTTDSTYNTISGTSMACPHVAGAAARYISEQSGSVSPAAIKSALSSAATQGAVQNPGTGSPNLLLYSSCA